MEIRINHQCCKIVYVKKIKERNTFKKLPKQNIESFTRDLFRMFILSYMIFQNN